MVAALACGSDSALSYLSVAACWELRPVDPVTIDISLPRRSIRPLDGVRLHRPRRLGPEDVTVHRGIPVTTVPRTLIDLAEVLSTRSLERALDEAQFLKLFDEAVVHAALARNAGRVGAKRLRATLRCHNPGSTRTRTPLEEDFYVLVMANGLPQPLVNEDLGPFTIDFLWPEQRLAVETDGGASHNRGAQRERDARRDAWLAARDYETLRFTWNQVHYRPGEVLAALEAKLT